MPRGAYIYNTLTEFIRVGAVAECLAMFCFVVNGVLSRWGYSVSCLQYIRRVFCLLCGVQVVLSAQQPLLNQYLYSITYTNTNQKKIISDLNVSTTGLIY